VRGKESNTHRGNKRVPIVITVDLAVGVLFLLLSCSFDPVLPLLDQSRLRSICSFVRHQVPLHHHPSDRLSAVPIRTHRHEAAYAMRVHDRRDESTRDTRHNRYHCDGAIRWRQSHSKQTMREADTGS
jgi:hypothetical protein